MELTVENQLHLAVSNSATSIFDVLVLQKELLSNQIYELENIVNTQCKLTGVNPLSQEMAAGALCVRIGKRPRDLLNPKAIEYMQYIFSIKDAINKKETRETIARFGVTASQVRDFFTSQRAKVRKFIRLSREKVKRTTSTVVPDGIPDGHDSTEPLNPVPLNTVAPTSNAEVHCCSTQDKVPSAVGEAERYFVDNIFSSMRKEETFSGQVKLMEWILQVQNTSVLFWFSVNGGIMILATWLSQAIVEEQTSVLHVILKVLCHLPLQKALPMHMSAVLQSVNKLRFYRASDISNKARILLSKWSKTFASMQALKRTNGMKAVSPSLDDMLLTQCINEVMVDDESWDSKVHLNGDLSASLDDGSGNLRKLGSSPLKLLPASADDQNKKLISGGRSSQSRERRKVLLVEQPGQRSASRNTQVSRPTNAAQGRPLSADDIQKAKMRAQFMQNRYGKPTAPSDENSQVHINIANKNACSEPRILQPAHNTHVGHKVEGTSKIDVYPAKVSNQPDASVDNMVEVKSDELPPKKCRRMETKWKTPPEFEMNLSWRVSSGESSKEIEVQKHRIRREPETVYKTNQEIPFDPKAPWDREMDYDDTLTPQIPVEQLPEVEETATVLGNEGNAVNSVGSSSRDASGSTDEPDMELLAELLKNPQLVFALTSGQAGNFSSEGTVRLLDMIKKNGMNSLSSLTDLGGKGKAESKIEVSLPSPTPSSNPVTNGRMPDLSKNPFSRGKEVANSASSHGFLGAITSQEKPPPSGYLIQPQILPTRTMVAEQPFAQQMMVSGTVIRTQEKLPAQQQHRVTANPVTQSPHLTTSQLSMLQTTHSPQQHRSPLINSAMHQYSTPSYASNMQVNAHNSPSSNFPLRTNPTMAHVNPVEHRLQPSNAPQPQHWRSRQGYHPEIDHHHHQQNNQDTKTNQAYGAQPFSHGVWERNELTTDEGRFESWSPDNSPTRSRGRNSEESSRMKLGYNSHSYREERPMPRNYGYPPAYGDPGNNGNKRWTERRR